MTGTFALNASDLRALEHKLNDIDRRVMPKAARWALNDVAFEILAENKDLMRRVFDNPTPFTLNAFYVRKASLSDLNAVIERKRFPASRHYLEVQSEGGARRKTGVERLFTQRLRYEGLIQAVVPTKSLRRNRYGNIAPGTLQRIISGVRAQGDGAQNTTAASRARANAGSSRRAEYFVPRADSALSPGVYQRKGEKLTKVLAFSEVAPSYSKRFPMEAHAEKVARDRIELAFDRAFARAMRGS